MTISKQLNRIERLHQLIRLKATGSPKSLANRLDFSERQLYRLIDEMKIMGFPITYCKKRQSYFYQHEISFKFEISNVC